MTLPTFDADIHDLGLEVGGVTYGFMRADGGEAIIQRQDANPATARSAVGRGRFDSYQIPSFAFFDDFEAGAGQSIVLTADKNLSHIGNGKHQGHFFPPYKWRRGVGDATYWMFSRKTAGLSTAYGINESKIEALMSGADLATKNTGAPDMRPQTDGNHNIFLAQENALLRYSPTETVVTPPGMTVNGVTRLGQYIWAIGTRVEQLEPEVVQATSHYPSGRGGRGASGLKADYSPSWKKATRQGSFLVMCVMAYSATAQPEITVPEQWGEAVTEAATDEVTPTNHGSVGIWYMEDAIPQAGSIELISSVECQWAVALYEIRSLSQIGAFADTGTAKNIADEQEVYNVGTVSPAQNRSIMISASLGLKDAVSTPNIKVYENGTPANEYTLTVDGGIGKGYPSSGYYSRDAAGNFLTEIDYNVVMDGHIGTVLCLSGNQLISPVTQFALAFTSDEGSTWTNVYERGSSGIAQPIAILATQGRAWFTTDDGLYSFTYVEKEFEDHTVKVDAILQGPLDDWPIPRDNRGGEWLATYDGALYYPVGSTVRRYLPNGTGEQIWPTSGWSAISGTVQALVGGEGGIYWGAAGVLWNYDGRGFHMLAEEPEAGAFDYLHWHSGRLFAKGSPCWVMDFGYPSMRPDIYTVAGSDYDVGYLCSPAIDLDKAIDYKVARSFVTHIEIYGSGSAATAGVVELQYRLADVGVQFERQLPSFGVWVTIGTHDASEGNMKRHRLDTPLEFQKLFLRVKVTPGTNWVVALEGYGIDGDSILERLSRVVVPVALGTDVVGNDQEPLYPGADEVREASAFLRSLRPGRLAADGPYYRYFILHYKEMDGSITEYLCMCEQYNDWLEYAEGNDEYVAGAGQLVAREIP